MALKVLPAAHMKDPHRVERFRREARAAAALQHAHIVPVYVLGYLFGGNPSPPVLGAECTRIAGCPEVCEEAP